MNELMYLACLWKTIRARRFTVEERAEVSHCDFGPGDVIGSFAAGTYLLQLCLLFTEYRFVFKENRGRKYGMMASI